VHTECGQTMLQSGARQICTTEPLTTGPKQLTEDGKAGVRRQWASSPWLMMMIMITIANFFTDGVVLAQLSSS